MAYGISTNPGLENKTPFLARNAKHSSLRSALYDCPAILYRAGQNLFWEDDEANSIFLVDSGLLHLSRFLIDGRRGVIGFIFPGEILGLSAGARHAYSAEAVTDCHVHVVARDRVNRLLTDSRCMSEEFIAELRGEISKTQTQLLILSQRCAEERVASFVLQVAAKSGRKLHDGIEVRMPMSRLDVADYLGLTVETVCRAFGKLKKANCIRLSGRGVVTIVRMSALMDFACDDAGSYGFDA